MHSNETFDPVTRVIGFSVKVAGREVPCKVTEDWLRDASHPALRGRVFTATVQVGKDLVHQFGRGGPVVRFERVLDGK